MHVSILGSGGGAPSPTRETSSVLVRVGDRALLLDIGTGARRLLTDPSLLDGVDELHIALTHFHFDHVCGLPFVPWLNVEATIWGPGAWLYGKPTRDILDPLLHPPLSPSDIRDRYTVRELTPGHQTICDFDVRASPQPRHRAPSAGIRVDDYLAFVTDTPYEASSAHLAEGVTHLLHEAWSASGSPSNPDQDATAADAARVASEAGAHALTLIHLNPTLGDLRTLLDDAHDQFERVVLGADEMQLS